MLIWLAVILAALSPILELRGSIPLGLALGLPAEQVILVSLIFNCLVFFPIYFGLELAYEKYFIRFGIVRQLLNKIHKKGKPYIQKWGIPGLIIFVAIPLPATGVWTATAISWLLNLEWKRAFFTISCGAAIAAAIVSVISLGVISFI
jgi:uncharacterized membrane protein